VTAFPRLDDRSDLLGLLALAVLVLLAAAMGLLPGGAGRAALDVAFVIFGYASLRALLPPDEADAPPPPDDGAGPEGHAPAPATAADRSGRQAPSAPLDGPNGVSAPGFLTGLLGAAYGQVALTCLLSLAVGAVLLSPDAAEGLALSALANAWLVANLQEAATGPAGASQAGALAHGWAFSLAAQWALLVAALAALFGRGPGLRPLMLAISALGLLSLAASAVLPSGLDMTLVRLFPFAAGGLLVAFDRLYWQHTLMAHLTREALLVVGLALMAAAILWTGPASGHWAAIADGVLPTLGTAAILFARGAPTLGHALTNPPLRWLGAAAVFTYLAHGPVFAFLAPALANAAEPMAGAAPAIAALVSLGIGAALTLAGRALPPVSADRVWTLAFAVAFAVATLSALVLYWDGRVPAILAATS